MPKPFSRSKKSHANRLQRQSRRNLSGLPSLSAQLASCVRHPWQWPTGVTGWANELTKLPLPHIAQLACHPEGPCRSRADPKLHSLDEAACSKRKRRNPLSATFGHPVLLGVSGLLEAPACVLASDGPNTQPDAGRRCAPLSRGRDVFLREKSSLKNKQTQRGSKRGPDIAQPLLQLLGALGGKHHLQGSRFSLPFWPQKKDEKDRQPEERHTSAPAQSRPRSPGRDKRMPRGAG